MMISPKSYPNFAFGWLELLVNGHFLPFLLTEAAHGWPILVDLIYEYLEFANPLLSSSDYNEATRALYRGLIRTFLVILQDAPQFLITFGRILVSVVPEEAIQLRNIILAPVPRTFQNLPDPLAGSVSQQLGPIEKIDSVWLAEVQRTFKSSVRTIIQELFSIEALLSSSSVNLYVERLLGACKVDNGSLDARELNFALLFLELLELLNVKEGENALGFVEKSKSYAVVFSIASDYHKGGTGELLYHTLTSIADGLVFPCNLTTFNHHLLIHLFCTSSSEVKEVITRVLLERLIVHRPHPWGVMITLIELVRNSKLKFWNQSFTHATPEIERVFEAISKSCIHADR